MDQDLLQDDEVQIESGQPDIEAAEQDTPTELPTDPEALKAFAVEQQQKAIEAKRAEKTALREVERQKERATELDTAKTYWHREAQRRQEEPAATATRTTAKPANSDDIEVALEGVDLAEYVTDDKGTAKLAKILMQKVVEPLVDRKLNERVTQEKQMTAEERESYQRVGKIFPGLNERDSELARETEAELERVAAEKSHLSGPDQLEIAAGRAAAKIGYKATAAPKPPANGANRLRGAQGGPGAGGGGAKPPAIVVTDKERAMARKVTGEKQSDEWILVNMREVAVRNQKRA